MATQHTEQAPGRFGRFGGRYVAATLLNALEELETAFNEAKADPAFMQEYHATLRDYRNALDGKGEHGPQLAVYGRTDQPCSRCGHLITRLVVGSRGTHICPVCQPEPNDREYSHAAR